MKASILLSNRKQLRIPLIQGGMGIGISLSSLASAVANEGGIGIISAAQIGFREPDFDINPLRANLRAMEKEFARARRLSPNGMIGFNIMKAMRHYEEYVKKAIQLNADVIITGAGLPTDLPQIVHDSLTGADITSGYRPLLAPVISTEKAAHVILKYWDKKYRIMPDFLVIEGPKAGGHLGFTPEQISVITDSAYENEIHKILQTVHFYEETYQTRILTVLAGGISTRQDAEHAFSLGADLIQVASRFITTYECDADLRYKQVYLSASKEDIILVKSPVGMPGRAIQNPFIQHIMDENRIPPQKCLACLHQCNPHEIPYCITEALIHAAKGEIDHALLFAGANAYQTKKIETVKEVIDSLF